jgi:transposase
VKGKARPHAGAHRRLQPNPTSKREVLATTCQGCGADVSGVAQSPCEIYDRVEIAEIKPDITRVSPSGGTCPCCAKRFKTSPPQGLEPGSPFGPNLRALVVYLRFTQGISFERLAKLLSDILGLEISEGGGPVFMPTSAASLKPPGVAPSAPSRPSVSPSQAPHCQSQPYRG